MQYVLAILPKLPALELKWELPSDVIKVLIYLTFAKRKQEVIFVAWDYYELATCATY